MLRKIEGSTGTRLVPVEPEPFELEPPLPIAGLMWPNLDKSGLMRLVIGVWFEMGVPFPFRDVKSPACPLRLPLVRGVPGNGVKCVVRWLVACVGRNEVGRCAV